MSDEELRALVRDSIARLRDGPAAPAGAPPSPVSSMPTVHASHVRFSVSAGADETDACVIEPAVRCTHCGFCQSYGH
jgi:hypothetical protein